MRPVATITVGTLVQTFYLLRQTAFPSDLNALVAVITSILAVKLYYNIILQFVAEGLKRRPGKRLYVRTVKHVS